MVSPGSDIQIPVFVSTEGYSGPLEVRFGVRTDAPEFPNITLIVRADLYKEIEVEPTATAGPLDLGEPATVAYRVTHRRMSPGRSPRIVASVPAPFVVSFVGSPIESPVLGGITEWRRDIVITIPARDEAGRIRATLRLESDGGLVREEKLSWEIQRSLRIVPDALTIRRDERSAERSILLLSKDRDVKILRVDGEIVTEHRIAPKSGASRASKTILRLDGERAGSGTASIRIATDHPLYPEVMVPVVVIPR